MSKNVTNIGNETNETNKKDPEKKNVESDLAVTSKWERALQFRVAKPGWPEFWDAFAHSAHSRIARDHLFRRKLLER